MTTEHSEAHPTRDAQRIAPGLYEAPDAATILCISRELLYRLAREQPERVGAQRLGRRVLFRKAKIHAIRDGEAGAGPVEL